MILNAATTMLNCFKKFVFHFNYRTDIIERFPPTAQKNGSRENTSNTSLQHSSSSHSSISSDPGSLEKLFKEVDRLLEGVDANKQKAYRMLHNVHHKVRDNK